MRNTLIDARGDRKQSDVAEALGISQKYISKLELGQRTPSLKTAYNMAHYYHKSVEDLFPDLFSPNSSLSNEEEIENAEYNITD